MPEYTVVLAGKFGVGKTSLFTRLKGERFRETAAGEGAATMARATEGLENYLYDTTVDGKDVKVTLWDTGGLERYESLTSNYYRFCHAVILVYDLYEPETLYSLREWVSEAQKNSRWKDRVLFALWGNKLDLVEGDSKDEAISLQTVLTEFGVASKLYSEVSAKTGENIEASFMTVVEAVHAGFSSEPDLSDVGNINNFQVSDASAKQKRSCNC